MLVARVLVLVDRRDTAADVDERRDAGKAVDPPK
jgi:hypothetical protein